MDSSYARILFYTAPKRNLDTQSENLKQHKTNIPVGRTRAREKIKKMEKAKILLAIGKKRNIIYENDRAVIIVRKVSIMQLATEITKVDRLENNTYELKLRVVDSVNDSAKIHKRVSKLEASIRRNFADFVPPPKVGELIVLDADESRRVLSELIPAKSLPRSKAGECVAEVSDFNSDGHVEIFMTNGNIEAMISPARGGVIRKLATSKGRGFADDSIVHGINTKVLSGFGFGSAKSGFDVAKTAFIISGKEEIRQQAIRVPIRAKVNGLKTEIDFAISSDSPVVSCALRVENTGKKAKQKKIAPAFQMRMARIGETNSDLLCIDPTGKARRYNRYREIAVWEWEHGWQHYSGDITTGNSGFAAFHREDTGEKLLVSFPPGMVKRVWMNQESQMPELIIFAKPLNLGKGKEYDFEVALCPLDDMYVSDGYLIGYIEADGVYDIVSAGPRARNLIIDGAEITPKKIGPNLYHYRNSEKPKNIGLTGDMPPLIID